MTLIERLEAEMTNTGIDMQREAIENIRRKMHLGLICCVKAYADIAHRTQIINKLAGG